MAAAAAAEDQKATPRRTKMVRVKQGYIDCLLREPTPRVFAELIASLPDGLGEQLRAVQAELRACLQRLVDKDLDILAQYRAKGYAMEEVVIYGDDDEEEGDDADERVNGAAAAAEDTSAGGVAAHVGACTL